VKVASGGKSKGRSAGEEERWMKMEGKRGAETRRGVEKGKGKKR